MKSRQNINEIFSAIQRMLLVLFCGVSSQLASQVSYDFAHPLPPGGIAVSTVDEIYFSTYDNSQSDIDYEFSADGIFAVSILYSSISRKMIRESSKYSVRNGYLFGVKENDSVPCFEEGDKYFFGIRTREQLAGAGSSNVLMRIDAQNYVINNKENDRYTPTFIQFNGKELIICYFSYADNVRSLQAIQNKSTELKDQMQQITLDPTAEEWKALKLESIMGEKLRYTR